MEFVLESNTGLPDDSYISVRAGTMRRQVTTSSGRALRFPKLSMDENPVKVDILKPVGTAFLVLRPGESRYSLSFTCPRNQDPMSAEIALRQSEITKNGEVVKEDLTKPRNKTAVKDAQAYLESHCIFQFVQALLEALVKDRPDRPYDYMAEHFKRGSEDAIKPVVPDAVNAREAGMHSGGIKERPDNSHHATDLRSCPPAAWQTIHNRFKMPAAENLGKSKEGSDNSHYATDLRSCPPAAWQTIHNRFKMLSAENLGKSKEGSDNSHYATDLRSCPPAAWQTIHNRFKMLADENLRKPHSNDKQGEKVAHVVDGKPAEQMPLHVRKLRGTEELRMTLQGKIQKGCEDGSLKLSLKKAQAKKKASQGCSRQQES